MNQKNKIYLDYAATTPVDNQIFQKMKPYFCKQYGNPASMHFFGQETQKALDRARDRVAKFLNSKPSEVLFTGSATESNNLAIKGLLKALRRRKRTGEQIHLITSRIEHKAILETCEDLEKSNKDIKITYLPVNTDGIINLDDLKAEITPETDLISIMYVNNEVGSIQPIKKIGNIIQEANKHKEHPIFFHTDAVQAANWLDCDVKKLNVDLLTISAHKIYGPKGVGGLYFKQGTPLSSIITGGDQEWGLRAGTENIPGIAGLGFAVEKINKKTLKTRAEIEKLRDKLINGVLTKISSSKLNGPKKLENRAPHIANFSFKGIEGEALVLSLSQQGIAASTGSACTSRMLKPSHVLTAIGLADLEAHSSLRISLGKYTTEKEINYFLKILPGVVKKLRTISGR